MMHFILNLSEIILLWQTCENNFTRPITVILNKGKSTHIFLKERYVDTEKCTYKSERTCIFETISKTLKLCTELSQSLLSFYGLLVSYKQKLG